MLYFRYLDVYFGCLDLYLGAWTCILGVWTCTLGVWTCIVVSGLVFWVPVYLQDVTMACALPSPNKRVPLIMHPPSSPNEAPAEFP